MNQHYAYSENSATQQGSSVMKHQTGLAMDWTNEEQTILENLFAATCSLNDSVSRYARISQELPNKTIRDVAMCCRWIVNGLGSDQAENPNFDDLPQDADTNKLFKENEQLFEQISANLMFSSKLKDNLPLLQRCRKNIMKLINKSNENVPEQMKLMPPLPETLNDDLYDLIMTA
ncbi:hypothetical protein EUTSA_v10029251mg [Eutrema salsugineum]|uniref:Myb-like domain-containing protein n=1 Tax=Eutrema salsugineum TaxID=72664 RepID=V4LFM4_EUTSA|nr:uncharacterized protein LOC18015027 [Eutrema salsugineum]ESQ38553.1 hypothetical protein EUTSA_v10029251mg [Eutrema salsugineum]